MGSRQKWLTEDQGDIVILGMSKMIKSMGKINLPILTSTFLAIPLGCFIVLSASSMVNLVLDQEARCDHKLLESSHLVPLSKRHSSSFIVALGRKLFQKTCFCAVSSIRRMDCIPYGVSQMNQV
ncbi:hypothetical protein Tco_1390368 [Tanacetum coccineum]